MKCLVTGGAGFVGSNLALELQKNRNEVIIVDNFFSGDIKNLSDFTGTFIEKDVAEDDIEGSFDVIFHQAAVTDPRYENAEETYTKNIEGFQRVVALAQKCNAPLVYASSASVYGNGSMPMQEDQEKNPFTAYAKSKLKMDEIAASLTSQMRIVGLRYFNVFGPKEAHKGRPASMVFHIHNELLAGRRPKLFKYGEQTRDYIYVKDVVSANLLAQNAPSGVYNVGSGVGISFNHIASVLNSVMGTSLEPEYIDNPYTQYQASTQADSSKAEMVLKFKPSWKFEDAVKDYYQVLTA